jgi:methylenetetrahydrofolate--tRNA-(uracil-5-)-methyltransferase
MVIISILIATSVVLRIFAISIASNNRIIFHNIPLIIIGFYFGGLAGAIGGLICDLTSIIYQPGWNPVFILSTVLWGLIPGLLSHLFKNKKFIVIMLIETLTHLAVSFYNTLALRITYGDWNVALGTLKFDKSYDFYITFFEKEYLLFHIGEFIYLRIIFVILLMLVKIPLDSIILHQITKRNIFPNLIKEKPSEVNIIGAGLAGTEAAYFLASKDIKVNLYEARPIVNTVAHKTSLFGELICSNSLKSLEITNASGLLKEEMNLFDSLVLQSARESKIEGGVGLVVDRDTFSKYITQTILKNPNITIKYGEVSKINFNEYTICAAGPLVTDPLAQTLQKIFNTTKLNFFDAVAPIIDFKTINMEKAYFKSRYDKGIASYINCPLNKEEYELFYEKLISLETVKLHDFENDKVFEGCMPIEVMALRGHNALLFGPMKPVGLEDQNGHKPYAVIQLRQDDFNKTMYNIVGFQTHLTFKSQEELLKYIPGLENAKIIRHGVMHKNTYLNSPGNLNEYYQSIRHKKLFFAGQITGVEGYLESASSGILAASYVYQKIKTKTIKPLDKSSIMGALAAYISTSSKNFVPMNANYGLLEDISSNIKNRIQRRTFYANKALEEVKKYVGYVNGIR